MKSEKVFIGLDRLTLQIFKAKQTYAENTLTKSFYAFFESWENQKSWAQGYIRIY